MTTEIVVKAHCGKNKEVIIQVYRAGKPESGEVIQDGDISEANYVYDDLEISVKEVEKRR